MREAETGDLGYLLNLYDKMTKVNEALDSMNDSSEEEEVEALKTQEVIAASDGIRNKMVGKLKDAENKCFDLNPYELPIVAVANKSIIALPKKFF